MFSFVKLGFKILGSVLVGIFFQVVLSMLILWRNAVEVLRFQFQTVDGGGGIAER